MLYACENYQLCCDLLLISEIFVIFCFHLCSNAVYGVLLEMQTEVKWVFVILPALFWLSAHVNTEILLSCFIHPTNQQMASYTSFIIWRAIISISLT